jgi:hypothetical protein
MWPVYISSFAWGLSTASFFWHLDWRGRLSKIICWIILPWTPFVLWLVVSLGRDQVIPGLGAVASFYIGEALGWLLAPPKRLLKK